MISELEFPSLCSNRSQGYNHGEVHSSSSKGVGHVLLWMEMEGIGLFAGQEHWDVEKERRWHQ